MKVILFPLGRIMHELQKERGCVMLFLCGKPVLSAEELKQKFLESKYALEEFTSAMSDWNNDTQINQELLDNIENITSEVTNLCDIRDLILNNEINPNDVVSIYSHKIISPIINLMINLALRDQKYNSSYVSAYANFLNLKERIARECAFGARGIILNSFNNDEFIENYRFLVSEQDSYQDTFLALSTESQKQCYERHMSDYSVTKIDELHEILQSENDDKDYHISPQDWIELATQKIDLLHKVEIDLVDTLLCEGVKADTDKKEDNFATGDINEEHKALILSLPIFKGLKEEVVSDLIKHAIIRTHKKGHNLFFEGENTDTLYIILNGWVKMYKGNSNGEETIVQMLTGGDMLAEAAVFLNAPYPVSAQVAKNAEVLALPAVVIRENIKDNNDLALNVLTAMSVHSQLLIQGLESIRLKSATERVGWFLLKMLLEQGRVPDMVELPYDKSLIASYLDMKPETFSRTLKKFKQKGFEIRKDSVILPKVKALCGFCDSDTASICPKHGTAECPNPDCISNDEIVFYD